MRIRGLILLLLFLSSPLHAGTINGTVLLRGLRNNSNAIIYIQKIPGRTFPPPRDPVVLDQINLAFTPHVLPVLIGTRVAFPNSDETRHNVFSPDDKFTLGTYSRGDTKYQLFNTPGEVTLLCNVHAEMSAYILVTETPYFAVSDSKGNYTISNVPAGRYKLSVWHERLKAVTGDIVVPETGSISKHFELQR